MMKARILVVDDHPLVRKGIAGLLKGSWEVCGQAADGQEAISRVLELKPDLVLLDLRMPLMDGTAAAQQIRRLSPLTKIAFLSMDDSETVVELARLAGADACLSKRSATMDLQKAIAAVLKTDRNSTSPIERNQFQTCRPRFCDPT
jgi:DNA-binding NarL/FixJ family response regulator